MPTSSAVIFASLVLAPSVASAQDIDVPKRDDFADHWTKAPFRHDLWQSVLRQHVDDQGRVDYAAIRTDPRFHEYLFRLAHTDPGAFARSPEKLAYWINAYNAFVIQGVLETLPVDERKWRQYSVLEARLGTGSNRKGSFFKQLRFLAGGRRYALDEIEKTILLHGDGRAFGRDESFYKPVRPDRPDARVHLALVCASIGCPPLARDAFEANHVDDQLTERVRRFVADPIRCRFNLARRRVETSPLFKWYAGDFTNPKFESHAATVIEFLARYVQNPHIRQSLRTEHWTISYLPWDWHLNLKSN